MFSSNLAPTRRTVKIGDKLIGDGHPPYVIAEIGGNFPDFETGKKLIDLAKESGADAAKLQNYKPDTLSTKKAIFELENTGPEPVLQYENFVKYHIDDGLIRDMFSYAKEVGIPLFSTPSHETDLGILDECGAPVYKIGSDDAVNLPFLRNAAKRGKPILLSTGMCTMNEVREAVDAVQDEGNDDLILFHVTSNYPAHLPSVNLRAMQTLANTFPFPVGYSDHTLGIDVCYTAAVMGASILEYHFTYDKKADGPDHMLSKTPEEAALLIRKLKDLQVMLGDGIKRPAHDEWTSRKNNRKSIVIQKDIRKGERLTPENIALKRPGSGIACKHYQTLLGRTVNQDLSAEDVLKWENLY